MISDCNTTKSSPSVFTRFCKPRSVNHINHARALWFRISVWPTGHCRISVADWDGDGHLDLIVISLISPVGVRSSVSMSFYQNQGGNGFLVPPVCAVWDEQNDCCAAWLLLTRPGGKLVLSPDSALSQIDGLAVREPLRCIFSFGDEFHIANAQADIHINMFQYTGCKESVQISFKHLPFAQSKNLLLLSHPKESLDGTGHGRYGSTKDFLGRGSPLATPGSRLGWWWLHRSHPGARRALLSQETWSGKGPDG